MHSLVKFLFVHTGWVIIKFETHVYNVFGVSKCFVYVARIHDLTIKRQLAIAICVSKVQGQLVHKG